jgi:hypothetical protein
MAMLGARSKQPTSRMTLVWVFAVTNVWANFDVKTIIMLNLFVLIFEMKSLGWVTPHRFLLQVISPLVLLHGHLFTIFCCGVPFCLDMCKCKIYYIIHKLITLMRASIHLRRHDHHVQNNMCKESMEEIKALVEKEVYRPNTKNTIINFAIASSTNKSLSQHLFNEDGDDHVELLKGKQLNKVMVNYACTLVLSQHS